MTADEIAEALAASPFNALFESPGEKELPRPPLPLSKGHLASLLNAGQFCGVIGQGARRHVVRGFTRKVQAKGAEEKTVGMDGSVNCKWRESDRMVPVVRTAWQDGRILTHEVEVD